MLNDDAVYVLFFVIIIFVPSWLTSNYTENCLTLSVWRLDGLGGVVKFFDRWIINDVEITLHMFWLNNNFIQ